MTGSEADLRPSHQGGTSKWKVLCYNASFFPRTPTSLVMTGTTKIKHSKSLLASELLFHALSFNSALILYFAVSYLSVEKHLLPHTTEL